MIVARAFGIVFTGLGNRAWGSGATPHIVGAIMMGFGMYCGRNEPLYAIFAYILAAFIFRVWSSRPWLHEMERIGPWEAGLWRSLMVLVIAVARLYFDHSPWIIVRALYAAVLIPLVYRYADNMATPLSRISQKISGKPTDPDAIAELLTGMIVSGI